MDSLLQQFSTDLSDITTNHHLAAAAAAAAATTTTSSSPLISEMAYTTDPNNNDDFETSTSSISKEDKYSLRPRSVRRVTETIAKSERKVSATSTHSNSTKSHSGGTKTTSKSYKPKQKPAPLSKYRRKTANARERNRMREINQAFETLRRVIPQMATTHSPTANEKLTKITTLRLAMKYISSLSASLNDPACTATLENAIFMEPSLSDCSDLDCLLLESDGESLPLSDHSSLLHSSPDFPETSLSPVDFGDPNSLSPFLQTDYDHSDFGDFLLT